MVWPGPRSSGVPTSWVTASTGTMVLPLAARTVRPPGMTTMAWVPPWPGILIGLSACWVTRSMGMTTFWTRTPDGAVVPVVAVAPVVTGGQRGDGADVGCRGHPVTGHHVGPAAVGEVVMAKSPRSGVPEMGSLMAGSATWVASSTGVTAFGHTT